MGGTLSSPLGVARPPHPPHAAHHGPHHHHHHHHPSQQQRPAVTHSTSVCNHLFSPSDGAQIYLPARQPHWPAHWQTRSKQHVHPEDRGGKDPHSRAPFVSPPRRELPPYSSLALSVDSNSNYAGYGGTHVNHGATTAPQQHQPTNGTVIPNLYSLSLDDTLPPPRPIHRSDLANNNHAHAASSSPDASEAAARTPLSPKHAPFYRAIGGHLIDERDIYAHRERPLNHSARASYASSASSSTSISPESDKAAAVAAQVHASIEVRRRTVMHASTTDLLRGLGRFVAKRAKIDNVDAAHVVMWMRAVDRSLLLQGWQDVAFINPANLVFVFLLMRSVDEDDECLCSLDGLHQWVLMCLYIAYSYMGNEISYPLKPFLVQKDKADFWSKCVALSMDQSEDMLRLNSSSSFFTQVFADLKRYVVDV
ncbi:cdka-1 [Pristionchus pacificus]|uniref:Cdka-1 n=1 Tax=Pristionchus pacificus TaxID=54126 RepID=A0A2A6BPA6_PRIPA|nr:cdka-1 [Pristionchus pacificus]|eukprot:PDM67656.1 cdka-1 [Pristionchus pacificus]